MKQIDFFIVGQGIVGTVLSHQLMEKGNSVHVFDSFKNNSASRIAAGVFNPVAYRKLKRAEFVDFLIPEMFDYYPRIESKLNKSFFKPMSFLKLLTDIEELNNWQIQCGSETNSPYMSNSIFKSNFENGIKNEFGAGQVLQSGVLNISQLIDTWKKYLRSLESLSEGTFQHEKLSEENGFFTYGNLQAKKIIFCEGVGISKNPWFSWLPIQKFKGEVLEISAPNLNLNRMVNRGVFLLPMGNDIFKVGATHDWKNVDEIPTEEGKLELTEKLDKIINVPYQIINHSAGLRPAARDRRPYIGVHPERENMYIINGLGSKGVIMAPWLIRNFIENMENHNWPKEFDIKRYHKFYTEQKN